MGERRGKNTPFFPLKKKFHHREIYVPSTLEECAPQTNGYTLIFCWFSLEIYFEKVKKDKDFEIIQSWLNLKLQN